MLHKRWPVIINILYILAILFIASLFITSPVTSDNSFSSVIRETVQNNDGPDDTTRMTYREFSQLQDKKKTLQQRQKILNEGGIGAGYYFSSGSIGFRAIRDTDQPGMFNSVNNNVVYYITLSGYKLDQDVTFNVKDDKYWLEYTVWDSVRKVNGNNSAKFGHYETRQVPFRFAYEKWEEFGNSREGSIMVPVSKKTYNILMIPSAVFLVILLIAMGYFFFVIPIMMLIRISKGEVFTKRHVQQLNLISIFLLAIPLLTILMQLILKLVFHNLITNEVTLDIAGTLWNYRDMLIASVVFFGIAKAFNRGLSLQKDQDLTI